MDAVPARDLSDESEAEAGVPWAAASGNAVERRKQTLARVRRNHRSAIGHAQRDLTAASLDRDLDGRLAMELRVLDEVADHSAQQARVSPHHHGLSLRATARRGAMRRGVASARAVR